MPAVATEDGRCGMVAGDDQDVRVEAHEDRQRPVNLFKHADLALEIAVLAGTVRLFDMNKK